MSKASSNDQTKKRILIVEDEPALLTLYTELLLSEGYDVKQAKDGYEAWEAIQAGGFDLVLLDIMLPGIDGLDILAKMATTPPQKPNNAVILLTNLAQDEAIAKGVEYGVRGYLIKSNYTPEEFLQEVKNVLAS